MDEQSLPRLMADIMSSCQSGNGWICYNKLRQGAKWIMLNDPPSDDSPSMLTMDMGTPVNDEYTHPEFVADHPGFAGEHGIVPQVQHARPGQGWNPEMVAGAGTITHQGWDPEMIRSGSSCSPAVQQSMYMLYVLDSL